MKTTKKTEHITVEKLVQDLKSFGKKYWHYDVACWAPDDSCLCVVGKRLDQNGDLCIELDEMYDDGGRFTVDDLLTALSGYEPDTKVYLAGCGLYLNFDVNPDGSIFEEADDDDIIGCHATVFGRYKEEHHGFLTEAEKRAIAAKAAREQHENHILGIVLMVMAVLLAAWLIYNGYALIAHAHAGESIWMNVVWIVVSAVLIGIDVMTLVSKD